MKKLFFVRHGYTEANHQGIYALESPLTDKGRLQAKMAGSEIKKNGLMFDLIIASPLSRTRDTAEHIANEIGYHLDKIEYSDLFVERIFGNELEGVLVEEFLANHSLEDMDNIEGAEPLEQLQRRAEKALKYIQSKKEDNILVVSHGAFGRALRRVIEGLPHTHEYSPENVKIANCEIVELI